MNKNDILNMSADEQISAFVSRCNSDAQFTQNAIAAVLTNEETTSAFKESLSSVAQGGQVLEELEAISAGFEEFSHKLEPIEQRLAMSFSGPPQAISVTGNSVMAPPLNHLNLVSFDGKDIDGLLVPLGELLGSAAVKLLGVASNIYKILPLGILITSLTQALLGTKAGPIILMILLII